jgi:hypothetical protein
MRLYGDAFWACLTNVPTSLTTLEGQLIDLPTGHHYQHVLTIIIQPAPAGGFHPVSAPFPGKVQGGDCTLFVKMGGNFNGFHNSILYKIYF